MFAIDQTLMFATKIRRAVVQSLTCGIAFGLRTAAEGGTIVEAFFVACIPLSLEPIG
jgi:hypothetical protein